MGVFTVGVAASYLDPFQTTTSKVELFGLSYAHCPPVQSSAVLLSTQINMHRVSMLGNLYEGIIVMACLIHAHCPLFEITCLAAYLKMLS